MKTFERSLIAVALTLAACHDTSTPPPVASSSPQLGISSDVFKEGATIPDDAVYAKSGCKGKNQSPDVRIDAATIPTGTKSFALLLHDPDAPMSGGFYHWVLFDAPASTKSFSPSLAPADKLPDGSIQGTNDFDERGYGGPCPPPGNAHHYRLTVYALDVSSLGLDSNARGSDVSRALKGHVLAAGTVTSTYGR
jgi:Raf kinase inhibitor-like YbhB/YbcL family protein